MWKFVQWNLKLVSCILKRILLHMHNCYPSPLEKKPFLYLNSEICVHAWIVISTLTGNYWTCLLQIYRESSKNYTYYFLTYTHLQNVNFYTHYIPYLYLPMNAFLRFRYWQLKVSFLIVCCVTFLIVSFFNIAFSFSTSFY